MKTTNVWQVMTPIDGPGVEPFWPTLVVAFHRREAIRVAEQAALALGFSFDGDIQVSLVRRAYTEDGE